MRMTQEFQHDDIIPNGGQIVERFGGIRPMASKLNVPVTTVQGWKKRDAIPAIRRDEILNAANRYDVNVQDLVGESANENDRENTIAEDPALARVYARSNAAPAPDAILTGASLLGARPQARSEPQAAPQPAVQVQAQKPQAQPQPRKVDIVTEAPKREPVRETFTGVDMKTVRKSARRTSFVTTTCLIALALGAGYLLFGQSVTNPSTQVRALDGRVSALEQQRNTPADNGALASLQEQVSNITAVIGTSAEGLAQLAHEVAAGTNAPLTQRLAVLEAQLKSNAGPAAPALSNLAERMESMAASPQGKAEWQSAIADLRNTVTGLSGRTDQLDAALSDARSQNDALGRTLSQVSGNDIGAAAMLLALTNLRDAVDRQAPFQQDLDLLKSVSAADPALSQSLDKLAPYAQTGIMSPAALKGALQASANDIITAKMNGENVSVKEKIMLHLKSLLSIRKDGMADGSGSEHDLIQTASRQLDSGDVGGAMATLQQLQGPAAQAAQPWQKQAQATLAAQTVDGDLVNAIISKVKNGLATAAGTGGALPGVVNAGPINMGAPSSMPAPATSTAPAPVVPDATMPMPPITQSVPPQTMAPMEQQSVPGVSIAPAAPVAPQSAMPQTEPQAGNTNTVPESGTNTPSDMPAPSNNVTISQ